MKGHSFLYGQGIAEYLLHTICVLVIIFAWGCGGSDTPQSGTLDGTAADASEMGSASFSVQWHTGAADADPATNTVSISAITSCSAEGVEVITCEVYDNENNPIASGSWPCDARSGRIDRIPAGPDRMFAVLGWNTSGGEIIYQGNTTTGITITAGVTADAGTIDANPFVPTGIEATTISDSRIDLAWDDLGVAGYGVYRGGVMIATTVSPAFSDTNLSEETQYCYTVSSLDAFNNESGQSDEACATTEPSEDDVDNDADGYTEIQGDCDDADANVNPGATEICGDGIDQDCNGADLSCDDVDNDGDGYSEIQGDCNDANVNVNPDAAEVCNGIDDNCAGGIDEGLSTDADGDRHYTADSCFTPNDDCDDTNDSIYAGATEICGDGIDQDCSGADLSCDDVDNDADGYSENQGDCNDADADVNPGAAEECNGIDDNCAGGIDEGLSTDADGDRHYTTDSCFTPNDDCDDTSNGVYPGATEVCGDGIDQDCNGTDLSCDVVDNDGDGYTEIQGDCDDADANVNPDAAEVCNGIDDNCAGGIDEGLTRSTTCGVGACAGNTGTESCTAGQWGNDTCDPDDGASS
jgi:hypothetical protein